MAQIYPRFTDTTHPTVTYRRVTHRRVGATMAVRKRSKVSVFELPTLKISKGSLKNASWLMQYVIILSAEKQVVVVMEVEMMMVASYTAINSQTCC